MNSKITALTGRLLIAARIRILRLSCTEANNFRVTLGLTQK